MAPSRIRKFFRLPRAERGLLVRTVLLLALARLLTRLLPFRRVRRLLVRRPRPGSPSGVSLEQVRWAIAHAERLVPDATCLPQALTAESLLARGGHRAALHIGVMKTPAGELAAHAWVKVGDRIVVGDLPGGLHAYAHLPPLPSVWPDPNVRGPS